LIPHSHDDVGWLETIDSYYYRRYYGVEKILVKLDTIIINGKDI